MHLCIAKVSCANQIYDIALVRAAANADFLAPEHDYLCNYVSSSYPDPIARFSGHL